MNTGPFLIATDISQAFPIAAMAIGGGIAIVSIIAGSVRSMVHSRNVEESRREIAAYVAEGSMTADDAYKLLNAGKKPGDAKCDG